MVSFYTLLLVLMAVTSVFGAIGLTLQELETRYGPVVEVDRYRPDLYPTGYNFKKDGVELRVILFESKAANVMVIYPKEPANYRITDLLERYSGVKGWSKKSTLDRDFAIHFPLFSASNEHNEFFANKDKSVFSLVQKNVASWELVIWLSTKDYMRQLDAYQKKNRKGG